MHAHDDLYHSSMVYLLIKSKCKSSRIQCKKLIQTTWMQFSPWDSALGRSHQQLSVYQTGCKLHLNTQNDTWICYFTHIQDNEDIKQSHYMRQWWSSLMRHQCSFSKHFVNCKYSTWQFFNSNSDISETIYMYVINNKDSNFLDGLRLSLNFMKPRIT